MPIPVINHMYSHRDGKQFIIFYVSKLTEDQQKTLEKFVARSNKACEIAQGPSGIPGVRLWDVSSNSDFKEIVKDLDEQIDIRQYVNSVLDQYQERRAGGEIEEDHDDMYDMFERIKNSLR